MLSGVEAPEVMPKLFGASAGEAKRTQVHGTLAKCAVNVPLLVSLGSSGLAAFARKLEELMPPVKRLLRESGVQQFTTFMFEPPAVSKPSLIITMLVPVTIEAGRCLPKLLGEEKVGQQWMQLIDSVHDASGSRGHPWHESVTKELAGDRDALAAGDDDGKENQVGEAADLTTLD